MNFQLPSTCLLAISLFAGACSEERREPDRTAPPTPRPSTTEAPSGAETPPSPTPTRATPPAAATLREFVATWVRVQNEGDFGAYEALYAKKFAGMKRSGPRTYLLDRAGWMKDRVRMFQKPMAVSAENVEVAPGVVTSVISFVQRWSSDNYSDVGGKHLLVIREHGELRISREDMLTSTLTHRSKGGAHERLAFTFDAAHLWARPFDAPKAKVDLESAWVGRWGFGQLVTARAEESVPDTMKEWQVPVRVGFSSGTYCDAEVDSVKPAEWLVPHFGALQYLDGTYDLIENGDMDSTPTPKPESEWRESLGGMVRNWRWAVRARLEDGTGCKGAPLFLQRRDEPPLPLGARRAPQRRQELLTAFEKVTGIAVAEMAKNDLVIDAFTHPNGNETLVSVSYDQAYCAYEGPAAWVVFKMDGPEATPTVLLKVQEIRTVPRQVLGVLDIGRDGSIEYIVRDWVGDLYELRSAKGDVLDSWGADYQDCPC